ncbi:hypothetical protein CXB36_07440 [Pseudomonas syringae pv. syringae]|nr:hypothetical protein BKC06_005545 [Pseudomonas syringae pv. syringae]POP66371.1 hypothetical protein CXB36_07440 [Pseudomonas syringae pv. syringae]PYD09897.1 hypothetical protein DND47_28705 [Pseudomonas syringae pv. syringae]
MSTAAPCRAAQIYPAERSELRANAKHWHEVNQTATIRTIRQPARPGSARHRVPPCSRHRPR